MLVQLLDNSIPSHMDSYCTPSKRKYNIFNPILTLKKNEYLPIVASLATPECDSLIVLRFFMVIEEIPLTFQLLLSFLRLK